MPLQDRTRITIVPTEELDADMRELMWALYAPHHNMDRASFDARIASLDELALFQANSSDELVGFNGLRTKIIELASSGRVATFYMGLTYISRAWRSRGLIQRMVIKRMLAPCLSPAYEAVYFWTDCLTYRPYLVMAKNLAEYYPHRTRELSPEAREVRDVLGRCYYGEAYDPERGTVRKTEARVCAHERVVTPADLEDPDIRYYMELNRNYARGDGVLALCPAHMGNLMHYLGRELAEREGDSESSVIRMVGRARRALSGGEEARP